MSKNILIVGGGTGGHVNPGIALYEKFREEDLLRAFFLTGKNDLRFASIADIDQDTLFTYSAPAFTRNFLKFPFFVLKFIGSILKALRIIRKLNIEGLVGMGGYVSAPALIAAKIKKVPIFLCEQNTVPGRVTTFFEKYCEVVFGTFKESLEYLDFQEKFIHCGNPIRNNVLLNVSKNEAKKVFNLGHCEKIILVIGGSQGALKLNELVFGLKKQYPGDLKNIGIIWSTGDYSFDKYRERIQNEIEAGSIYLSPYIKKIGKAYNACDVALSRSGSGVMMELAAAGVPSVLIPYPFAAMDHQNKNADSFVKAGAAVKIMNEDAVPEKVAPALFDLLNSSKKLKLMSENARKIAMPDSADIITSKINEILKSRGY